jgi:type I restriction-modification system DNA methylase subunit
MATAASIFEPSAGNGLLVMGADPKKTHVNEIDHSRRKSLEYQGFKTITHWNASAPFPKTLDRSFDVVVTNPPFAPWEAPLFDKKRIIRDYFNNQQIAVRHMRLEHLMVGLALHTLKDSGKAAMICMGHISFGLDGHIAKYPRFFNWLYRHYRVDDIINLNSFALYNKQGTVKETMLILVSGRKPKPKGAAPRQSEAPYLADMVNSFEEVWQRVSSHIKSPLEVLIQKLKIEQRYDIF